MYILWARVYVSTVLRAFEGRSMRDATWYPVLGLSLAGRLLLRIVMKIFFFRFDSSFLRNMETTARPLYTTMPSAVFFATQIPGVCLLSYQAIKHLNACLA